MEDGNAYTIRIINDTTNNTADLEVWQAQGLNRYNIEYHKSTATKCADFDGTNDKGTKLHELTKNLEHMTISKCSSTTGNCTKVSDANNFFCFLPDGLHQKMLEEKCKPLKMQEEKKTICILMKQVFLITGKECNEFKT